MNNTKLEFTNYGYNNIAWFRFGDDYVSNSDKFVFLDRSGKYNHLSCSFNDENGNFVSPFDGKFLDRPVMEIQAFICLEIVN